MNEGKAVGVISLNFRKFFDTIFHNIHGLDGFTLNGIKNCLNGQAQRVVVNKVTSSWQPSTSGVSQGSILRIGFFHIFINDQEDGIKYTLRQLAEDTKLGWCVGLLESRKALQSNLGRLNQWHEANWMRFNKMNARSFTWIITTPCSASDLRENGWKSCLAEKAMWVLVDSQLNMSQELAQVAKKANGVLDCIRNNVFRKTKEVILTLHLAQVV